jgi:DNA-directed RNA polymerase subunit RPC12/RpoP
MDRFCEYFDMRPNERTIISEMSIKVKFNGANLNFANVYLTNVPRLIFLFYNSAVFNMSRLSLHLAAITGDSVEVIEGFLSKYLRFSDVNQNSFELYVTDRELWKNRIIEQLKNAEARLAFESKLKQQMTYRDAVTYDGIRDLWKSMEPSNSVPDDLRIEAMIIDLLKEGEWERKMGKTGPEGLIDHDNRRFVNKNANVQKIDQKVVQYQISASFDLGSDGTIKIKCPFCGAGSDLASKTSEVKCTYCGKLFIVPKKVLDMI